MAGLNKVTVDDISVKGKKVLVRVDFNVPLKDGVITNDNRITAALPTIKKLVADGGKVVLCSHLGKPKNGPEAKFSLAPAAARLAELVDTKVVFAADDTVVGENAKKAVAEMADGEIVVLENTRFRGAEETKNGEEFSKELADLADDYVCDAFGSSHRAHASVAGVTKFISAKGGSNVVGYLMQKEIDFLGNAVENPVRPFVAILGGAKVADKLNVISNLLEKCDTLIIGGGMAFTFLKAEGKEIGKSLVDDTKLDYCKEMMAKAEKLGKKLLLPVDAVVAASFPDPIDAEIPVENVSVDAIPDDKMGLDIGAESAKLYAEAVKSAKTVVWNGPMGVFEMPNFAAGTIAVAKALSEIDGNAAMDTLKADGALKFDFGGELVVLTEDDLLIEMAQTEGYVSEGDNYVTVALDTHLTPELLEEGFVRELVSKIQTMRKEAGFEVTDHINVYQDNNDKIADIFKKYADTMKGEVLADHIFLGQMSGYAKEWNINGETGMLGVEKATDGSCQK